MRKVLILICSCFFISIMSKGQTVSIVNDPLLSEITASNWASQLAQAGDQFVEIMEQKRLIEESIESLKKVNQHIMNMQIIVDIIDKQVMAVSMLSKANEELRNSNLNTKAIEVYSSRLVSFTKINEQNVKTLKMVLSDYTLKLSDYERLQMIEKINEESTELLIGINNSIKQYNRLNRHVNEINRLKQVKN